MWCDIKDTKYGEKLQEQIGKQNAKEFSAAIETEQFKDWFGNGKTVKLDNGSIAPFINPVMQIINEKGQAYNILERFPLKNYEAADSFFNSKAFPGITQMTPGTYSVARDSNRYINQKLIEEVNRLYPDLLTLNNSNTIFTINKNYDFVNKALYAAIQDRYESRQDGEDTAHRKALIEEAQQLGAQVKGVYGMMFQTSAEQILFEAAQQLNASESEKREAQRIFGDRISEIAHELYPNAKAGDTFKSVLEQRTDDKEPEFHNKVVSILDKLSMRFSIPYRLVNDSSIGVKGYYDKNGVVVINKALMTKDTPFHEFLHPFMLVLEKENPHLYNALATELKTNKDGMESLAYVNRKYSDLTDGQRTHEAIVNYLGKLASDKYEKPTSTLLRVINWLKSLFKKINIDFKNLSLNTTLSDIADMVVDDLQTANLKSFQLGMQAIDMYQRNDTDLTYQDVFERIKDKILILNATIKKRKQGDQFKADIDGLKEMLDHADEITSINNFVSNAVNYVDIAQKRFESLRDGVKDPSKISKADLSYNMHQLSEIQQLLNVYASLDDIKTLFRREGVKFEDDTLAKLSDAIEKKNDIIMDFKNFALTYLTEWLHPYLESTNANLIAEGKQDKVLTKDNFRELLKTAISDIDASGYWLGAAINSKDAVSGAVGLALKDSIYNDHVKNLKAQEELQHEYDKIRGTKMFTTKANEQEFNMQFLREVDNWEQVGENEDGTPKYDYKKRLAFHTPYLDDQWDKSRDDMYERVGQKPPKSDRAAYSKWSKEVSKWYQENTILAPDARNTIEEKRRTLSKRHFERWFLDNTKEVEEEIYDSGLTKSSFYKDKVYSHNTNKGTFRIFAGELVKPSEKWRNRKFDELMTNDYYKKLYAQYKDSNDKLGNFGLKYGIVPQQSKGRNLYSKLKWEKGVKENLKTIGKHIGSKVKAEYDENNTVQRQDGTEVKKIPIKYTTMLDDSDLDTDLLKGVLKFTQMANNFDSLTEIEPNVLILKTVLNGDFNLGIKGREIAKTNSKGAGVFNSITKKFVPKMAQDDMVNRRLNDFVNDVMYGDEEVKASFNLFGHEISINKLSGNMGFLTAMQTMAINFTGGLNNVIVGNFNNSVEAVGGRFWGKKDWLWAHGEYFKNLHTFLGEIGGMGHSPINQLAEHYSVPQGEFQDHFGNHVSGGKVNQLLKTSSLFFLQKGGEHEIQITGLLSLMHATQVRDKQGNTTNLYEAWKQSGYSFDAVKQKFDWNDQQDTAFRNRLHVINKNLHGVYNKFDKAMLQRRWYGKLALMFRKYMFTAFRSRYGTEYVDYELGTTQEGYWNTFFKKAVADFKDYKWGMVQRMWTKEGYNAQEKAAAKKTLYEFTIMMAAMVLAGLKSATDDDDETKWVKNESLLQLTRLSNDINQYVNPADFLRVVKNPAASINMINKWIDWGAQLTSPMDTYKRKSGFAQAGDNKLYIKTLKVLPVFRQWINTLTPEEQIKFYQLTGGGNK